MGWEQRSSMTCNASHLHYVDILLRSVRACKTIQFLKGAGVDLFGHQTPCLHAVKNSTVANT